MSNKIGRDFIINEDELKLIIQASFISGYCAERNKDYGKLGWEYACKAEQELVEKIREQNLLEARAKYISKGR